SVALSVLLDQQASNESKQSEPKVESDRGRHSKTDAIGATAARLEPLVLFVDDDRANRIVFEQSLAEFNVITASDGQSALRLMEHDEIAVLVTDMRMPGMSGEELLRIAKSRHPHTIRMVVTAYQDVDPILRAINDGLVARYIIKPWVREEL